MGLAHKGINVGVPLNVLIYGNSQIFGVSHSFQEVSTHFVWDTHCLALLVFCHYVQGVAFVGVEFHAPTVGPCTQRI